VSNFAMLGYRTAREMYDAFQADERWHVLGFFDFVCRSGTRRGQLADLMRRLDFTGFARIYNGPGQAAEYGRRMAAAHQQARQLNLGGGRRP
jgi:hypothetical protein